MLIQISALSRANRPDACGILNQVGLGSWIDYDGDDSSVMNLDLEMSELTGSDVHYLITQLTDISCVISFEYSDEA